MNGLAEERLIAAVGNISHAFKALELTREYVMERKVFGKPLSHMQNTQFKMAEMFTELSVGQTNIDQCISSLNEEQLTSVQAAQAKLFTSELLGRVVDECVQLHGGNGYMDEYAISKLYTRARVARIYGGTSEIMKIIIGREVLSDAYTPFFN